MSYRKHDEDMMIAAASAARRTQIVADHCLIARVTVTPAPCPAGTCDAVSKATSIWPSRLSKSVAPGVLPNVLIAGRVPGVELNGYIQRSSAGDGNVATMVSAAHGAPAMAAARMARALRRMGGRILWSVHAPGP